MSLNSSLESNKEEEKKFRIWRVRDGLDGGDDDVRERDPRRVLVQDSGFQSRVSRVWGFQGECLVFGVEVSNSRSEGLGCRFLILRCWV